MSALKPPAALQPPKYVQKLDKQGRAYATGKRKDAVARVWIKMGAGTIVINDRPVETYFARPVLRMLIQQPLVASNRQGQYDVVCTVSGGGLSGQAGAVRHGLSKALLRHEPDLRPVLKRGGFFVAVPIYVGILVDLEGLAVSFVLRTWTNDVPSIVHACRLSRGPGVVED